MKKIKFILLFLVVGSLVIVLGLLIGTYFYFSGLKQYVTTDFDDYGHYIGNYDNKRVHEFINSFFPFEIEDCFSDVKYSYRAEKGDTCAFEAYLEVSIKARDEYEDVLEKYIGDSRGDVFVYDSSYNEVVHCDYFYIGSLSEKSSDENYHIEEAYIGKILYCKEEQKIIFVALGVYDGGWTTTDFLNVYFERFDIDPYEYARSHADRNRWMNPLIRT